MSERFLVIRALIRVTMPKEKTGFEEQLFRKTNPVLKPSNLCAEVREIKVLWQPLLLCWHTRTVEDVGLWKMCETAVSMWV
mmetsp:Transcript_6174/g.23350  ORF Transcript_6174/g.23350 Transcript_6174/m.23350 type:complete len:81 (-) Transcript_6174:3652-3894(-)